MSPMIDWTVPLSTAKTCDLCNITNGMVQAFTLVHTVYKDGLRKSRSAGGMHLCRTCWKSTGGVRRRHGSPRPELSATMLEAAAMRREARSKRAKLGKSA